MNTDDVVRQLVVIVDTVVHQLYNSTRDAKLKDSVAAIDQLVLDNFDELSRHELRRLSRTRVVVEEKTP